MPTTPRESISRLPSYTMAPMSVPGVNRIIQLGQNELGIAPSPAAVEVVKRLAGELPRYPDMEHSSLRRAIADVHGLNVENIACGAGSMELMGLLATIYCEKGVEVIVSQFGYKFFQIQCAVAGADMIIVPEPDMCADIDAIAAAVTDATRLVFVVNPNNPTGTTLARVSLRRLRDAIPDNILIILDGAYAEFADPGNYDNGFDLVDAGANIVVLRTFSKAYGLAGLRVGWLYGPADVIQAIANVRAPNSVTTQGLAAAEAAVRDQSYLSKVVDEIIELRENSRATLQSIGLQVYPSGGNFLLVRFTSTEQANTICEKLLQVGIIVRPMDSYGLSDCLRITIGSRDEMSVLQSSMKDFL